MTKLYQQIASSLQAIENCRKSGNEEWLRKHRDTIAVLVKDRMPRGSGFDSGTAFDFNSSNPEKLVFLTLYHHMNDDGYYDGWTDHAVTVRPSLAFGFDLTISGRDRRDIKEYIAEVFDGTLRLEIKED
jgi:hypothetical protein